MQAAGLSRRDFSSDKSGATRARQAVTKLDFSIKQPISRGRELGMVAGLNYA